MIKTICHISDTHESHHKIQIPECDLLIHSGDFTFSGQLQKVRDFLDWFNIQPARYKVFIAGNHELSFESDPNVIKYLLLLYKDLIYLENSRIELEGLKLWGSPITPWFHDWAFNKARGEEIRRYWEMIPNDTDVLITHGPPSYILDRCNNGNVGCGDLMNKILALPSIKYHFFGHVHEGYGMKCENGVTFVNSSILDGQYILRNVPQIITLD